jgi:8-oxo-dGTP diphosphatase
MFMKKVIDFFIPRLIAEAAKDNVDRFVVAGVISKDGGNKVLCLKRAGHDFMPGLYELPSGKVELKEDLVGALIREVKEETNLKANNISDYISYFDYYSQSKRLTRQINFVVQCESVSGIQLSEKEHEGYTWVSANEINNYNISVETKNVIRAFFLRQSLSKSTSQQLVAGYESGVEQFVVGGVIGNKDKALIMKRAADDFMGGIYELPSGKLEKGECVEMGLVREVLEETNLVVTHLGKSLSSFDYKSGSGKHTRQLNFDIFVQDPKQIKLSEEHEGFAWISSAELANYLVSGEVKAIVFDYLTEKKPKLSLVAEQGLFSQKRERENDTLVDTSEMKKFNFTAGE